MADLVYYSQKFFGFCGVIYTVGSSTRTREEFLRLLHQFGIRKVVDVRRFPTSRFQHFRQENLAKSLQDAGIDYVYLGKELGGYRRGGYQSHLSTSSFREGLERLETEARDKPTAVLCAERFPWKCHRRFIGVELARRGWKVVHIIDENRTWEPKVEGEGESPDAHLEGTMAEPGGIAHCGGEEVGGSLCWPGEPR